MSAPVDALTLLMETRERIQLERVSIPSPAYAKGSDLMKILLERERLGGQVMLLDDLIAALSLTRSRPEKPR